MTTSQFAQIVQLGLNIFTKEELCNLIMRSIKNSEIQDCMQHPLGFYNMVVYKENAVTIRLHYWPGAKRPVSSAVTPFHDHVWSLQSCVLKGSLRNIVLELEPHNEGRYAVANIAQISGVDTVVPTSMRVNTEVAESTIQAEGNFYSIAPSVFHFTEVTEGIPTITCVRAEIVTQGGPRTLVPFGYTGQAPSRQYLPSADTAIILREIAALLS